MLYIAAMTGIQQLSLVYAPLKMFNTNLLIDDFHGD